MKDFVSAKAWMLELAAQNEKKQVVLGFEPKTITGLHWMDDPRGNKRSPGRFICSKAEKRDLG